MFPPASVAINRVLPSLESFGTGIVGDGTTDDSDAIKAAHDAAYAAGYRFVRADNQYYAPSLTKAADVHFIGYGRLLGSPYRKWVFPPNLGHGFAPGGNIREKHLTTFLAAGSPVVNGVGDSTLADYLSGTTTSIRTASSNNDQAVHRLAPLWGAFRGKVAADNGSKALTFNNRGIGGTTAAQAFLAGTAIAGSGSYKWLDPTSATWDTFWLGSNPDLLLVHFGTNGSGNNQIANDYAAIRTAIQGNAKIPSTIWSTPYGRSRMIASDTESTAINNQDRVAGFIRTFAEFYDEAYIDMNRIMTIARDGFDPVASQMRWLLDLNGDGYTTTWSFPEQTWNDYEISYTFTVGGTTALPAGGRVIEMPLSMGTTTNILRISNVGGFYATEVQWDTSLLQPNSTVTSTITVPAAEATLIVSLRRGYLQVATFDLVSGTYIRTVIWEGKVARYGGPFTPRIRMSDNSAVAFYINYAAVADPVLWAPQICDWETFGWPKDATTNFDTEEGGNDVNHPAAATFARVTSAAIERLNFGAA